MDWFSSWINQGCTSLPPAAPQASGPAAPHPVQLAPPLHPGSSTPLPPCTYQMVRWRCQPLPTTPQGQQDPHTPACRVVCGAQITAITKPWYHDLNWEGSEGVGLPWRCFIFVLRTICMAQLVLECVFLAVAGGGSSAAEYSQPNSAGTRQGFSKCSALQSESSRMLLFSEKCCPCPLLMKANLVFSRSRPELFQTWKTADTNQ